MKEIHNAFAMAVEHQQCGRECEAMAIYRQILLAEPTCAAALNNLGLMLPPTEAVDLFRRAVVAEPNYIDALVNLSSSLRAQGDIPGAAEVYGRATSLILDKPDEMFRLALALQAQGRFREAAALYDKIIALRPRHAEALCNLGTISDEAGRPGAAIGYFRRAWQIAPDSPVVGENLVIALENAGKLSEAQGVRASLPRPRSLMVDPGIEPRRTVLLAKSATLNVPLRLLLSSRNNTVITWLVEYATEEQVASLPPYDIAFNTIGNADVLDEAYDRLDSFARQRILLNPPHAIAQTRRDRVPRLLDGIPNVVVPAVVRIDRDELVSIDLGKRLIEEGLNFPILARPIVGHGGDGVQLIRSVEELGAIAFGGADAYYFIQFYDFKSADDYWRKYRVIFVDRIPFAYHLAISKNWLVHYFSADMLAASWKRHEEQRFVENASQVLQPHTMTAIAEVGRRLDLDYGGMDFGVLDDGRLLVFEANASMLVHLNDSIEDFSYKHDAIPHIIKAFESMLDKYCSCTNKKAEFDEISS